MSGDAGDIADAIRDSLTVEGYAREQNNVAHGLFDIATAITRASSISEIRAPDQYHVVDGLFLIAEAIGNLAEAYADRTKLLANEARDAAARRDPGDA